MKKVNLKIILILFLISIIGAVINNLITSEPVRWIGGQEVLEKPEDLE